MRQNRREMRVIGITGGVGSGKSSVLYWLKENYCCRILMADEAAHRVQEPGGECYEELRLLLGPEILREDETIDRVRMAERIFADQGLLKQVEALVHPAVKRYICSEIERERLSDRYDFFFVEAALLIEDGYDRICDELWYIHAAPETRRQRLKSSRGYSDEKTESIMKNQADEKTFRQFCRVVIDNSGSLEEACAQIKEKLEES